MGVGKIRFSNTSQHHILYHYCIPILSSLTASWILSTFFLTFFGGWWRRGFPLIFPFLIWSIQHNWGSSFGRNLRTIVYYGILGATIMNSSHIFFQSVSNRLGSCHPTHHKTRMGRSQICQIFHCVISINLRKKHVHLALLSCQEGRPKKERESFVTWYGPNWRWDTTDNGVQQAHQTALHFVGEI